MSGPNANRFVFFGATGDLAAKQIFPALQALTRRGYLDMPVIGLARSDWTDDTLRQRARESIEQHDHLDPETFAKLAGNLHYLRGDYGDDATFERLRQALGSDARPLFYLAIPPDNFENVVTRLARSGAARDARLVLEKPFGRDLASAQELEGVLEKVFPENAIFRIDHFLGKEPVQNLRYFRFANAFVEALWNRHHIDSIQITMAEKFGVQGRGAFYDGVGAIRDVVQNHLLQVLALLTVEPPEPGPNAKMDHGKVELLAAMRPLTPQDVVRGQFRGYLQEPGVAPDSNVETFAALRIAIDNERWSGVPFFIRAGKCLPVTATEVVARLKAPAKAVFEHDPPHEPNYFRFRLGPDVSISLGGLVKVPGEIMKGQHVELIEHDCALNDEMRPYDRLLGDAIRGETTLFAEYEAIEATWRVVDPALNSPPAVELYEPGTWGPDSARALMSEFGGWHDPEGEEHGPEA
ncbi:MAG: glucose-6-phosphate dehydrogenase [Burkholderiaceae bacterium]